MLLLGLVEWHVDTAGVSLHGVMIHERHGWRDWGPDEDGWSNFWIMFVQSSQGNLQLPFMYETKTVYHVG